MGLVLCLFNETATPEIYTYGHTLSLHDALPILKFGGVRRCERGQPDLVAVGDSRRSACGVAVRDGCDIVRAQPVADLAERLFVAHYPGAGTGVADHQSTADRQKMRADDRMQRIGAHTKKVVAEAGQGVHEREEKRTDA